MLWAVMQCSKLCTKYVTAGYGTEAVSYVAGLLQSGLVAPEDLWISQSGDYVHKDVLETMDPGLLQLLHNHHYKNMTEVGLQHA
jgi:hypothetical protein